MFHFNTNPLPKVRVSIRAKKLVDMKTKHKNANA